MGSPSLQLGEIRPGTKLESLVHYFLLLLYVKVFCVNALQKVQKQREIALLAAVEALLEASAAEKLLKCLR